MVRVGPAEQPVEERPVFRGDFVGRNDAVVVGVEAVEKLGIAGRGRSRGGGAASRTTVSDGSSTASDQIDRCDVSQRSAMR